MIMKLALLCLSLVVVTVTVCRSEFCDEGPPGKYCLEDLSGYHDCHVDPKTKKMVDTVHKCTVAGTRLVTEWEWVGKILFGGLERVPRLLC